MQLATIPVFPEFRPLTLADKPIVETFTAQYEPYSDFNFVSVWTNNIADDIQISNLNGNFVMKFRDYISNEPFYTFLGHSNVNETVSKLLSQAIQEKILRQLKLIPETVIKADPTLFKNFEVIEDIDNHDYIISIPKIKEMKGKHYLTKRRLVRIFKQNNPYWNVRKLDLSSPQTQQDILNLFSVWEQEKHKSHSDTEHELIAIRRLLRDAHMLDLLGFGVFVTEKLCAFAISQPVHNGHMVGLFSKSNPTYKGIGEVLHYHFSQYLHDLGYKYHNFAQDLGFPNLRRSKELWQPIKKLKKYIVKPKNL